MAISLFATTGASSAWQQMQTWQGKQRQATAEFESSANALASAVAGATSSSGEDMMAIVMRKAVASAQQRVRERIALMGEEGKSLAIRI
jgi:hypothetical protein